MPWCDALSRPVAHSASSRTAHGYTLVIHTRAVEITRELCGGRGESASQRACAPSWRPSALLANSSFASESSENGVKRTEKAYHTPVSNGLSRSRKQFREAHKRAFYDGQVVRLRV